MSSLLQSLSAALLVCDAQGLVSYANAHAESLLGVVARRLVGQHARSLFRLETPDGDLLATDRTAEPYPTQATELAPVGCVLVRSDRRRVPVTCEMAAIGGGARLLVLRRARSRSDPGTLAYRASHDALTGLPNRSFLEERLENLHRGATAQGTGYSLLLLDLDHFKSVNDRYGHATGDRVLNQTGRRIAHNVRELDTAGRWGGEEFLCLLPDVSRSLAEEIAERIRAGVESHPVDYQGSKIRVTLSIGVATFPEDGSTPHGLLAHADAALYEAKRAGRNRIQSGVGRSGNLFALGRIIEKSLQEGRVQPTYQPIVDLVSSEVCGAQARARIRIDDDQGMDADDFIPAAERLSLAHRIDHRVIQKAIMHCTSAKLSSEPIKAMFVSLSVDFLRRPDLTDEIRDILNQQSALSGKDTDDPPPLVIEIAERQFKDDVSEARERLRPFLDLGTRIAIKDFGAGGSSLDYLIELPVAFLKLDAARAGRICREPRVRAVFQGIQQLASTLGIKTVAEGIENEEMRDALREIGVSWGQGIFFSRPESSLGDALSSEKQVPEP